MTRYKPLSHRDQRTTRLDRSLEENDIVDNRNIPTSKIAQEVSEVMYTESSVSSVDNRPFRSRSTEPMQNTSQADPQFFIDAALNLTWQPPALHLEAFQKPGRAECECCSAEAQQWRSCSGDGNQSVDTHQAQLTRRKPC